MDFHNYLSDAINTSLNLDIPDEFLADAVISQAGYMARAAPEDLMGLCPD